MDTAPAGSTRGDRVPSPGGAAAREVGDAARGGQLRAPHGLRARHAAVREGDTITIDIDKCTINLEVPEAEIAARLKDWKPREPRYKSGVFHKYTQLVGSAARGAVTDGTAP